MLLTPRSVTRAENVAYAGGTDIAPAEGCQDPVGIGLDAPIFSLGVEAASSNVIVFAIRKSDKDPQQPLPSSADSI